jgi:disulfide oxidoreductase YuzD
MSVEFIRVEKGLAVRVDDVNCYNISTFNNRSGLYWDDFHMENVDHLEKLLQFTILELPSDCSFSYLGFFSSAPFINFIHLYNNEMTDEYFFELSVSINTLNWNKPFTIRQYSDLFINEINCSHVDTEFYHEDDASIKVSYRIKKDEYTRPLIEISNELLSCISKAHIYTETRLLNQNTSEALTKIFDFPSGYENICSQYLMWFGEFLKNLGIEADVHTEPRNGQTALIITPSVESELFGEIEKLFYQYLQFPYVEVIPKQNEMSIQYQHTLLAVKQQVQFLEMQIESKDAIRQNNNATIISLNTTIDTQKDKIQSQADKLTLINALVENDKWVNVPFTKGTLKCKDFGSKNISIQFEPLAIYNKLFNKKEDSDKE